MRILQEDLLICRDKPDVADRLEWGRWSCTGNAPREYICIPATRGTQDRGDMDGREQKRCRDRARGEDVATRSEAEASYR